MSKLLKKGHQGVITQLFSLDFQTFKAPISPDFQRVLNNPSKVFEYIEPTQDLDHDIHLILGRVPSIIIPYRYSYV